MEWKITTIREATDIDINGRFYRYKVAEFTVDSAAHTLRISMKDFDEGRTREMVEKEAQKLISALKGSGTGSTREGK